MFHFNLVINLMYNNNNNNKKKKRIIVVVVVIMLNNQRQGKTKYDICLYFKYTFCR